MISALKSGGYWDETYDIPAFSGNPHVVLSTYLKILRGITLPIDEPELGYDLSTEVQFSDFYALEKQKVTRFRMACIDAKGVLYRWPGKSDPRTSHDEIIAVASDHPQMSRMILVFLQDHLWIYDSKIPWLLNPRWWLRRIIHFPAFIYLSSKDTPSWIDQKLWCYSVDKIVNNPDRTDTSDRILIWLEIENILRYGTWRMIAAALQFNKTMQNIYPGGPQELLGHYYGKGHPFALYSSKSF